MKLKLKRVAVSVAALASLLIAGVMVPQSAVFASSGSAKAQAVEARAHNAGTGSSLVAVPSSVGVGNYLLKIVQHVNGAYYIWCLDADSSKGYLYDGAKVQLWICNSTANQIWHFNSDGYLENFWNRHFCLDVDLRTPSSQSADGHRLWVWSCALQSNQRWSWNTDTDYSLRNHWNAKCADANANAIGNGDTVALWGCVSNKESQSWYYSVY